MAEKRGRRGLYETHVLPFFEQIDKMLNEGASEEQVANALGVSYSAFCNYKKQHKELDELCSKPRQTLIESLRSALVKRAKGFQYEERRVYKTKDENGNEKTHTEIIYKQALPDVAALNLALKNYDKENWSNDPQSLEIKRQELELRKMALEMKDW